MLEINEEQRARLTSEFCRELLAWLQNPTPSAPFSPLMGLCGNAAAWARSQGIPSFRLLGVYENNNLPFNSDLYEWIEEMDAGTIYDNPLRLGYLRRYAAGGVR